MIAAAAATAVFWGIWLLIPVLIDLGVALTYTASVFWPDPAEADPEEEASPGRLPFYPPVTVIIPFWATEGLEECLASLAGQRYPMHRLDVICVANGPVPEGAGAVFRAQEAHPQLKISLLEIARPGKSGALNAGIYSGKGEFICSLDADVRLHPDALGHMVGTFIENPEVVAATGAVLIDPVLPGGRFRLLHLCELLEYASAFRVGRRFQSLRNRLYTLTGAFSVFRRNALQGSFLYDATTVSEDTMLTFHLRQLFRDGRLTCVQDALCYTRPSAGPGALYAQRLRWQRGQLEVSALHPDQVPDRLPGSLRAPAGRVLLGDHTLALSRLTWMALFPALAWVGYPTGLLLAATGAMYLLYVAVEAILLYGAARSAHPGDRQALVAAWVAVPLMPLYRVFTFLARVGGMLDALVTPAQWRAPNPMTQLAAALRQDWAALRARFSGR